jgi:hypothetical protein
MATRITPIKTTRAYQSESGTQMVTATGTVMTAGVDYLVNMSNDLMMVLSNDTIGALTLNVTSYDDKYGRTSDISESVGASNIVARRFARAGWSDENGDMNLNVQTSDCTVWFYEITNLP